MGDLLIIRCHENAVILSYIRWAGSSFLTCALIRSEYNIALSKSHTFLDLYQQFQPPKTDLPRKFSSVCQMSDIKQALRPRHLIMKQFSRDPTYKMWRWQPLTGRHGAIWCLKNNNNRCLSHYLFCLPDTHDQTSPHASVTGFHRGLWIVIF